MRALKLILLLSSFPLLDLATGVNSPDSRGWAQMQRSISVGRTEYLVSRTALRALNSEVVLPCPVSKEFTTTDAEPSSVISPEESSAATNRGTLDIGNHGCLCLHY